MNTPNKLTVLRMIMVPFFLLSVTVSFPHHYLVALIIFAAASITDYFDGMLARKHNLITNFGKFLDPLADKMLTTSALLSFVAMGYSGALWVCFITLFREFLVSGIRLAAVADGGKVVAANIWGKLKTVSQMVAIIVILFSEWLYTLWGLYSHAALRTALWFTGSALLWISAILTVISGVIYLIQNAEFINYKK